MGWWSKKFYCKRGQSTWTQYLQYSKNLLGHTHLEKYITIYEDGNIDIGRDSHCKAVFTDVIPISEAKFNTLWMAVSND